MIRSEARNLVVVAAEQEAEEQSRAERDRDRRARVLPDVLARVGPEVAVVLLEALRRRLRALAHVVAQVVELVARARIRIAEDLLRLVDLLFDEVTGAVKRGFFRHTSPPTAEFRSYTLGP